MMNASGSREERLAAEIAGRLDGCPEAGELVRHAARELHAAEREAVVRHLEGCDPCSEALRSVSEGSTDAVARNPVLPPEVESRLEDLIESVRRPARPEAGSWAPLLLRAAAAVAFVGALAIGANAWLGRSDPVDDLGTLRGGGLLQPLAPLGTVEVPPVEMRWEPHPSAASYEVVLLDARFQELWRKRTDGAEAILRLDDAMLRELLPGSQFTWEVIALDSIGAVTDRSPAAHFEIAAR